jgi:hypothetical protein
MYNLNTVRTQRPSVPWMGLINRGATLFNSEAEARAFSLGDMPLVQRLKSRGISMDSETYLSRGLHTLSDAALSRVPLTDLGTPTVVVRHRTASAFGQFRHQTSDTHAYIVFVAPAPQGEFTPQLEAVWLRLLDALGRAAGERGAHNIHAEVDENSPMFALLRQAGYASYTGQDIWRRAPAPPPVIQPDDTAGPTVITLRKVAKQDMPAVRYLHARIVPRLAQKADPPPGTNGLVAIRDREAYSYISVRAGDRGIYLKPYLHPDDSHLASAVLASALALLDRTIRVPVYCCVRQYQSWLGGPLEALGFQPWARQTVLVKHTTARIEHPAFAPLPAMKGGITIHGGQGGNC